MADILLGIDIGGTKINSAQVSEQVELIDFQESRTPTETEPFFNLLVEQIQRVGATVVGIATAGAVNANTGQIIGSTANLPAVGSSCPLASLLQERTGAKVHVENDANAAAYGEFTVGAAQGHTDVLMITLGTGIGGGAIIDGKLLRGAHHFATEVGHMAISMEHHRQCNCGRWDCWEAYASGSGLTQTINRARAQYVDRTLLPENKKLSTHDLVAAWRQGDTLAHRILDQWHHQVALGLGNLLNILDPELVVIGGGMAPFINLEVLTELTLVRAMSPKLHLVKATLGNKAGLVGAALLASERYSQVVTS
jgi:glucokinase